MNPKTLKTLEFDKILAMLRLKCGCCVSRELAPELKPFDELDDVNRELDMTSEAETVFIRTGYSPVDDFPDMRQALKRMNAVLHLSCEELLNVGRCLKAIRRCREQLIAKSSEGGAERMQNIAGGLMVHQSIEDET